MKRYVLTEKDKLDNLEFRKRIVERSKLPKMDVPDRQNFPIGMDDAGNLFPVGDEDRRKDPRKREPLIEHATGALLGLALGDALGTTMELTRPQGLPRYPTLLTGPQRELVGGGPFELAAGQVTDDTQMASCLAAVLRAKKTKLTVDDLADAYAAWLPYAFDAGRQTRRSLQSIISGEAPFAASKRVWLESGKRAAGNGSLMRTTPIALFFARDQVARCRWSAADSMVTHWDPRCVLACVAFNGAIASAVRGDTSVTDMIDAARDDLGYWANYLAQEDMKGDIDAVRAAEAVLIEDLDAAMSDDPGVHEPGLDHYETQGFVRVAFRLAFWHLSHSDNAEASLVDLANRGGDSDTNAAITGALLGARLGHDAFPLRWKRTLLGAVPKQGAKSVFATLYHPVFLVGQTKALLGHELPKKWLFF
ncbi:MAG: ADP-ribosylglycohydrolase family protein [Polyangia bacterium]